MFQKSTENTTCQLYSEMHRLGRLYASNALDKSSILAAGDDLSQLTLCEENQLDDEHLRIGTDTWACIAELEEEEDLKPFFSSVRNFDLFSLKKMLKNFLLVIHFSRTWEHFSLRKLQLTQSIQF